MFGFDKGIAMRTVKANLALAGALLIAAQSLADPAPSTYSMAVIEDDA